MTWIVDHLRACGFGPTDTVSPTYVDFVARLPAPEGTVLEARLRLAKSVSGSEPRPTSVIITRQETLLPTPEALWGALPEAAQGPLLAALEPWVEPPAEAATAVCDACGMRTSEFILQRASILCRICADAGART